MSKKLLKLCLSIALYTNGFDAFQDTVYLEMTDDIEDLIFQAGKNTEGVKHCVLELFWEGAFCTATDSNPVLNVEMHIDIDCAEFEGHLDCQLFKEEDGYCKYTPELKEHIKEVVEHLRRELSEMLCDMAKAYYTGAAVKGVGEHYEYWEIETAFRNSKLTIGLANLHGRSDTYCAQEVYAALIAFNFVSRISRAAIIRQPEDGVYAYKVNFKMAAALCREYLRTPDADGSELLAQIARYSIPIRPGRQDQRKMRQKSFSGFCYRVAA